MLLSTSASDHNEPSPRRDIDPSDHFAALDIDADDKKLKKKNKKKKKDKQQADDMDAMVRVACVIYRRNFQDISLLHPFLLLSRSSSNYLNPTFSFSYIASLSLSLVFLSVYYFLCNLG